jgi:DNA polymerase-3 subunit beta
MSVSASDLETTLTTKIPVKAEEKGKVAIPARILMDTLKELAEMPLSFLIDNKTFYISIFNYI